LILLALLAAWALPSEAVRDILRERTFDWLLPRLAAPHAGRSSVVIVDIDRASLARLGPWPWPRARMAELVSAVAAGHPACVAIDILFAGPDRLSAAGDQALAEALSFAPSVIGFVLDTGSAAQDVPSTPVLARSPVSLPGLWRAKGVVGPAPVLVHASQGLGALVAAADPDGPIRRIPLLVSAAGAVRPGLAVEAARVAQGAAALLIDAQGILRIGNLAVPLGEDASLRLWPTEPRPTESAARLLEEPEARTALDGRVVLIGSSAPEAGGLRVTPASPATPSVLIQASALDTILRGEALFRPAWTAWGEPAAAVLLGLLCLLLAMRLRPARAAALAVAVCFGWAAAAIAAVPTVSALVDPAGPPLVAILGFALAVLLRFVHDEWRAQQMRRSFEQHLAPAVVRRIAENPTAPRLRGELREVTALFTDIEGFTSMTERADPADLVALLDAYFDVATSIVTEHGGMIDKIVGDAIHAIFNAPLALDDHPRHAVAAALALIGASEQVRHSPLGQRLKLGRTRIGIETGPAIVGDVGGSHKLDYTAHGNAINAAARLEAANKELGTAICIGPGAAARLDPATLRQVGTVSLRGQTGEISVYTPVLPVS
jgi:adenylate cyclase